jgi:hypothetical protein
MVLSLHSLTETGVALKIEWEVRLVLCLRCFWRFGNGLKE